MKRNCISDNMNRFVVALLVDVAKYRATNFQSIVLKKIVPTRFI